MQNLISHIVNRLKKSEYWLEKSRDNGSTIQNLICPECGDTKAWAYSGEPWSINCNRLSSCGSRTKIRDLFPDLFVSIEKRFKPTSADPNRPATAYLKMRNLNSSINGLKYKYQPNIRKTESGGVLFHVTDKIWNGRLFNPPPGEGKTHNIGSTAGQLWKHPSLDYESSKEIYVTEGVFDALSLIEMDFDAIAVLSSGQNPSNVDLPETKNLIFAFDNDPAGHSALKKWRSQYPDAKAIMPVKGDWNDFLSDSSPKKARSYFDEKRPEFEFMAKIALSVSAKEYVNAWFKFHDGMLPGLFVFNKCYYHSIYDKRKDKPSTHKVSNFTVEVLHYSLNNTNKEEPINNYFIKVKPKKGRSVSFIVSAKDLSTPSYLTAMFLQRTRCLWEGDRQASLALARMIVESRSPVVRQLQTIGYDLESDCYVFKHFLIDNQGKIILPNPKGIFELSKSKHLRPAQQSAIIKPIKGIRPVEIYNRIYDTWNNQGAVALAWMVASWFVNQIKKRIGFFPFLSYFGDTQTGKTALARIQNACQGLDGEGLPMRKVNTSKGEIRKIAQLSGLFQALLESSKEDNTRFDLDGILTLYNPNPLQIRARTTNDIQTHEIPFLASLLFVQNNEPFKTKAQRERVISLKFKKDEQNRETTAAFNKLHQTPLAEFSYFFPFIMKHRKTIEVKWFGAFQQAKEDLKGEIQDARINENHALILAFHRILCEMIKIENPLRGYIEEIGSKKQQECSRSFEDIADFFFDIVLSLDTTKDDFTFSCDLKETDHALWLYLPGVVKVIRDEGYPLNVQLKDLQSSLQKHPAYKKHNISHRFSDCTASQVQKAWVFDIRIIKNTDDQR